MIVLQILFLIHRLGQNTISNLISNVYFRMKIRIPYVIFYFAPGMCYNLNICSQFFFQCNNFISLYCTVFIKILSKQSFWKHNICPQNSNLRDEFIKIWYCHRFYAEIGIWKEIWYNRLQTFVNRLVRFIFDSTKLLIHQSKI